jgi:site-specific recombinase XerD
VTAAAITNFRFHDCRHHFASWYMMRGGDLYSLSKILGHSKVSMTEKYAHLAPDHLRAQMAKTERSQEPAPIHNAIHNTAVVQNEPRS